MTTEGPFILCFPVHDGYTPPLESEQRPCAICARPVWVSPSSMELVASEGARPLCTDALCVGAAFPQGIPGFAYAPGFPDELQAVRNRGKGNN